MKKNILTALVALLSVLSSFATNYYAAPQATGDGSEANPCSLKDGISKLSNLSNDTLFLRGGIYELSEKLSINKNGTKEQRIAIFAYAGEQPILDFRTQRYGDRGVSLHEESTCLHIKGLTICYAGDNGLYSDGSYHIVENCVFHDNSDSGCQFKSGCGNLILNCDSYNNFDYQSGGTDRANFGGNADGFADKQYNNNGEPNVYDGCRAWGNSDDGWDFFQKAGNTVIRNSICFENGPATYNMENHPRYETDKAWFDQFPVAVTDDDGGTPTIALAAYKNYGNGNGFKVGGEETPHNVRLENCLSVNNTVKGFDQNNNAGEMTFVNCSGYGNAPNYGFNNSKVGSLTINNSVSLAGKSGDSFKTPTRPSMNNNSWNLPLTCNADDFESTDINLVLSPRNTDGSLADIAFMRLKESSDLIDKGICVGLPFAGSYPDLGYKEYGEINSQPAQLFVSGNLKQNIIQGEEMEPVVFTWVGASGLDYGDLPAGITPLTDNDEQSLTLTGIPINTGEQPYTITTIDGVCSNVSISGVLTVSSANAKRIAYVTNVSDPRNDKIFTRLSTDPNLSVSKIDGTVAGIDFSTYDMLVLCEFLQSDATGIMQVKAQLPNLPILNMKVFAYPKPTWSWGGTAKDWTIPANTTSVVVPEAAKTHPIFKDITFTGTDNNELQLISQTATNNKGINSINPFAGTAWSIASGSLNVLGTIKGQSADNICLMEIPLGTVVGGNLIEHPFLQIGLSGDGYPYATDNTLTLVKNAVYYLADIEEETNAACNNSIAANYKLLQTENTVAVQSSEEILALEIYSVAGSCVSTIQGREISTANLPAGVYLLKIVGRTGVSWEKFVNR